LPHEVLLYCILQSSNSLVVSLILYTGACVSKVTAFAKVESKGFGISWIPTTNCWRLVLGSEKRTGGDPYIQEYFSPYEHGSKKVARAAAEARRDELMGQSKFKKYYRYQLNGRRVKRPRSTASVGVTGVVFTKGRRVRNGMDYFSPSMLVYSGSELVERFPLRKFRAQGAFHSAVKSRYILEGRRYVKREVEDLFKMWTNKSDIFNLLTINEIPLA
jgi:hypothetical protein